ncbi:hypothetical protein E2C01_000834 [Portunus trituberculatus]|uniref:Uncharacterized protein n=1 Tax=Portunus trituberculatus TaxID=210409 RepID=A0A5B7CIP6_PORTR|nr:hypothetical protein [Portunus trituberculatus]
MTFWICNKISHFTSQDPHTYMHQLKLLYLQSSHFHVGCLRSVSPRRAECRMQPITNIPRSRHTEGRKKRIIFRMLQYLFVVNVSQQYAKRRATTTSGSSREENILDGDSMITFLNE